MNITIHEIVESDLICFLNQEKRNRLKELDDDLHYLNYDHHTFSLMMIYGIFHLNVLIGFCLIPSYQCDILSRFYITPEKRRLGIGTFVINKLKIKQLNCLSDNDVGIAFYKKNGFIIQDKLGMFVHSYRFIKGIENVN